MLLWIDGFDSYGTSGTPSPAGIMARKYAVVGSNLTVVSGRLSGYALNFLNGVFTSTSPGTVTTDGTMVVGLAIKFNTVLYNGRFLSFYDGATEGMNLRIQTDGELAAYLGNTFKQATLGLGIVSGSWYYIEFKVLCAASGTYEVCVNGVSILSGSGDTRGGSHSYNNTFYLQGNPATIDDLYCLDSTGSINNDFLGNMRVETIRPSANGTSTQWTPNTGINCNAVKEQLCDDNTTYVEDGTMGHKDLYTYANLTGITFGVKGVKINTDAEATDVSAITLIDKCSSNGTESNSSQTLTVNSYTSYGRILETDPSTVNTWTVNAVNAAEFGIEVG